MKRTVIPKNARLLPPDAKLVFKGTIHEVYQWEQKMYDGTFETFEMLKRPDTVKVIAVKDGKIVMLEQQQPDSQNSFYDLPGGRHDEQGEDELQAVKRETLEETGMTFRTWKLLDVEQPAGKIDYFVYTFLATDFENQIEQNLGAGEKINIELIDFNTLKKLIHDPKTRHLPRDLIESVDSLDELIALPDYIG